MAGGRILALPSPRALHDDYYHHHVRSAGWWALYTAHPTLGWSASFRNKGRQGRGRPRWNIPEL